MDLGRLAIFVAVVDHGTMSAAARAVHLTQPAVSRNVQLLEEDVDAPLFVRGPRRLSLTAAGRALLPRARTLLRDAERVRAEVRGVATRAYFDLRIGTVDSVATYLFPAAVEALNAELPDLAVKLRTGRTATLLDALGSGELDLAVIAWSGPPSVERHERIAYYSLRYWGRADRFPRLTSARTEEAVQQFPLVEIEALPGQPTMIPEDADRFAVAGSLASVKALVLAGFGVGGMLDFMLSADERGRLVAAPLEHDPDCALYLVWSPTAPEGLDAAARIVARAVGEAVPSR